MPGTEDPDTISPAEFSALLAEYPAVIEALSAPKGGKLLAHDEWRYKTAPAIFSSDTPLTLTHLTKLVEWKMSHGKFRPSLLGHISSNASDVVEETVREAATQLRDSRKKGEEPKEALKILCKLKGIGPATASLVLSVHDPARTPFFSDEIFWWVCCGGNASTQIKYTAQEYSRLYPRVQEIIQRLGVSATDVEMAAFVIMRRGAVESGPKKSKARAKKEPAKDDMNANNDKGDIDTNTNKDAEKEAKDNTHTNTNITTKEHKSKDKEASRKRSRPQDEPANDAPTKLRRSTRTRNHKS